MKQLILALTTILIAQICYSQNVKISEPEFSGVIVFVNDSTGSGLPLEMTKIVLKTKGSASLFITGIGKATTKATVKGKTSTVKVKQKNTLQFVYRGSDNTVNPADVIQLIRFTVKGNNRESELASSGTFTGSSSGDIGFVPFTAKKYKTSSYLVTITNLAVGEYGFSVGKEETKTVHMFSVE
jgi:hypothetical protein